MVIVGVKQLVDRTKVFLWEHPWRFGRGINEKTLIFPHRLGFGVFVQRPERNLGLPAHRQGSNASICLSFYVENFNECSRIRIDNASGYDKNGVDAGPSLLRLRGFFDVILSTLYWLSQGANGFRYHVPYQAYVLSLQGSAS